MAGWRTGFKGSDVGAGHEWKCERGVYSRIPFPKPDKVIWG